MKWLTTVVICVMVSVPALQAKAAVEVEFVKPEAFADIGNRWKSQRVAEDNLSSLRAALIQRGEAVLRPGQDMKIRVTDVNLAGKVYPNGFGVEAVRNIRPLFIPSMEFSYVITDAGGTVREGKAEIVDPSFMDRFNRYWRDDPLHFEKPMLDDWFSSEFGVAIKVARR